MRAFAILLLAVSPAAMAAASLAGQWRDADPEARGYLTRKEAARVPRLAGQFDAIDRDQDGRITADEVRAWRKLRRQSRRAATAPASGAVTARYFSDADDDADGLLTRDEVAARLPRLMSRFGRIDIDASGALSRGELDAWFALRRDARRRP